MKEYGHRALDRTLVLVAHRQFTKSQSPDLRITNPVTVRWNTVLLNPGGGKKKKKKTITKALSYFHYVCNFVDPALLVGGH